MKPIPYSRQWIAPEDIEAVVNILKGDWLTQGPAIEQFEKAVSEYCSVKYAVAVSSGTAALHIACLAAGFQPGDILWTSPNTFVASANCALYCGGRPDFVDIDSITYNLSVSELEHRLQKAEKTGSLPKIIIPVHFAGQSCEMKDIYHLSRKYGFIIIEDASHAIGGEYLKAKIGGCSFSEMTTFSFHPVKTITTGEGGMVLTNKKELFDRLVLLRSHGITRDADYMQGESHGPWYYQQVYLGFNYRITDIQAALGLSQMKHIDNFVHKRRLIAERYNEKLGDLPLTLPWQHPDMYSAFHLYVIRLQLEKTSKNHRQVFEELRNRGINVNLHYIPVHTQPYYRKLGFRDGDFPEAEKYYSEAISLPIFYSLTEEEQDRVVFTLKEILA